MKRPARGVTILEVLVVVAIVGILSAVAAGGLRSLVANTRIAQTGRTLASSLRAARTRAVATSCPHFVQVNGPTYAGLGPAGYPARRNMVNIIRKADCTQNQAVWVPGDLVIDSFPLHDGPLDSVRFVTAIVGNLGNNAFGIGYDRLATRTVWVDAAGGGQAAFADITAAAPAIITIQIQSTVAADSGAAGTVSIPAMGNVRFP